MPIRKTPLVTDQFYHVFNRTINTELAFRSKGDYKRTIKTLDYYRFTKPPMKLSHYLGYGHKTRLSIVEKINNEDKNVDIICYCLMPNHFHLLLQQKADGGISKFMANFQNSYTKYVNTKHDRYGHLFAGQFKAVRIETDEVLLHISRYIHLNPYSSHIAKDEQELIDYPYSSLSQYIYNSKGFCNTTPILNMYLDRQKYKEFVLNNKDYQRKLKEIRRFILEK